MSAGHCVEWGGPSYVYFGSDPTQGGSYVRVQTYLGHPQYNSNLDNDISVVILADPAPAEIAPIPISTQPPGVGAPARFVGFGYTEIGPGGEYGRKYQMTAPVTAVDTLSFEYGVATCNGDSGGPAFLTFDGREVLAGVTSWGDETCAEFGVDTRVDAYAPWIEMALDEFDPATCEADGRCAAGCAAPDPDCPCAADSHCTDACTVPGADPDCPAECGLESTCRRDCPIRDPDCAIVPVDGECESDFDCGDNICDGVCRPLCDPLAPVCDDGLTCREAREGVTACLSDADGGCRVTVPRSPRSPTAAWLLPAVVIGTALARRRKRR